MKLLFSLFIFSSFALHAQLQLTTFNSPAELNDLVVRHVNQDSHGFIWLGTTQGLYRFDGSELVSWQTDPVDDLSLAGKTVYHSLFDNQGKLWLATNNGLSVYDETTNRFTNFRQLDQRGNHFQRLALDSDGNLWIAGTQGISVFDPVTHTFSHFEQQNLGMDQPISDLAVSLSKRDIWIATINGIHLYQDQQYQLTLLPNVAIRVLEPWTDNRLIAISKTGDVYLIDNHQVSRMPFDYFPTDLIYGVTALDDALWVSANENGFYRCDWQTKICHYHPLDSQEGSVVSVTDIFEDSDENIWVATERGIRLLSHNARHIRHWFTDRLDKKVVSVLSIEGNRLLLSTMDGVYILDLISGQSERLVVNELSAELDKKSSRMSGLYRDYNGDIWVGSFAGLGKVDVEGMRVEIMPVEAELGWGSAFWHQKETDILWIGTQMGGLIRYNLATGEYQRTSFDPQVSEGLSSNIITSMFYDQYNDSDHLWLSTFDAGLNRLDLSNQEFTVFKHDLNLSDSLSSNTVKGLYRDGNWLWISSWSGLNRLDLETHKVKHFVDSQPNAIKTMLGMVADHQGDLWLSSVSHIAWFDTDSHQFVNFEHYDGLRKQGSFTLGGYHFDHQSNRIYFAGSGVVGFDPQQLRKLVSPPRTKITQFLHPDFSDLAMPPNEVILPTDTDEFGFEFVGLDFVAPQQLNYRYKLEGHHKQWQLAANNQGFVRFNHLPSGQYRFVVSAQNRHGLWDPVGSAISVILPPPWWQSWWAIMLYVLALVLLLVLMAKMLLKWRFANYQAKMERLEQQVTERTATIAALLRQKNRLFAHISHEFRTPLTLMLKTIRKAEQNKLPITAKEFAVAKYQGVWLVRMVDQLLALAKLNVTEQVNPVAVELNTVLNPIITGLQPLLEDKKLTLKLELPSQVYVLIEQAALEKIMLNLLSNAVKYNVEGGEIYIEASYQQSEVNLAIRDTGFGIAQEDQQAIFDYFVRKSDHKIPGTGIGLAMVKELVEAHNGRLSLQSELGQGSCFTVILPKALIDNGQSLIHSSEELTENPDVINWEIETLKPVNVVEETKAVEMQSADGQENTRVLIVDDHRHMAEYIMEVLLESGQYDCAIVENGRVGLERAAQQIPDLVISDVMMPDMDGFELLQALKQNQMTSHIPVILLTAKNDDVSRLHGLGLCADDYLTKPFNEQELVLRVSNIIAARHLIHQQLQRQNRMPQATNALAEIKLSEREQQFQQQLDQVLAQNYQEADFSVAQLAQSLHITLKQLQRKIKALYGETPTQYIRHYRLNCAAKLILQGCSLQDVAHQVGFADYGYFSRVFKAYFAVTPAQYGQ